MAQGYITVSLNQISTHSCNPCLALLLSAACDPNMCLNINCNGQTTDGQQTDCPPPVLQVRTQTCRQIKTAESSEIVQADTLTNCTLKNDEHVVC